MVYQDGSVRSWSKKPIENGNILDGRIKSVMPGLYYMIVLFKEGKVARLLPGDGKIEIEELFDVPSTAELGFSESSRHVVYRHSREAPWMLYIEEGAHRPPNIIKAVEANSRARFFGIACHPQVKEHEKRICKEDYAFWIE